ncbi:serine hydrolase [Marinicella sp. W31]|uniref:serine hydrolase n=1 Tax=Marinicella sp. W31 TaxID=3023713 RepID=UPI003758011F
MKKNRIVFIFLNITVLIFSCTAEESSLNEKFKVLANELYEKRTTEKLPGAYMLAMKSNAVLHQQGFGYADFEHQVPVTDQTVFDLASIAKMFTGYAIAELAEQGLIDMDAEVQKYLPQFPVYDHKITVAHLVHHTSGVKNWTEFLSLAGWSFHDSISFDQITRLIYAQKSLDFIPGTQFKYSNSGYNLLVKIIENVSGLSFVEWTEKNIFVPLKMDSTFFNDQQNRIIPHLASGYYIDNNRVQRRAFNNLTAVGSSSLFSNAGDIQKWMTFLLHPPKNKQRVIKRMFSTRKLSNGESNDYAYGINVRQYRETAFIGHSGSWASNTSYLVVLPEQDAGIFIVHNFSTYTQNKIEAFTDLLLPEKEQIEEDTVQQPSLISLNNNELDQFVGTYKLGVAWYVTISRKGNQLYTQANGEPAFIMDPISKDTFIVPAYRNRTIKFLKNTQGEVDAFSYINERRPKLDESRKLNPRALTEFEGTYYNIELGALFELKANDEGLFAHNHKHGVLELNTEEGDEFYGTGILRRIVFSRDQNKKIKGFYISNSRGKKQWLFSLANP